MPQEQPAPQPAAPAQPTQQNPDVLYPDWSTQKRAYHNVRVLCDLAFLSVEDKNTICACIYQESQFINAAKHENIVDGRVASTDWGLCQINDYYNVGSGRAFSSVQDIVDNPQKAVQFMIQMFGEGQLHLWVSYSSGAYKQWLEANSPMWALSTALPK